MARAMADNPKMIELTPEEGDTMFDERCRELMGISPVAFVRGYEAGEYDIIDTPEHPEIIELAMLRPR